MRGTIMGTLLKLIIIGLLITICVQQTSYLNADWCSEEVDTLRSQIYDLHSVLIGDQEVTK